MLNTKNILLLLLASITTGTSVSMVVSNAITHGVGSTNQTLLSIFALTICLGAHLLPAWSRYLTGWVKLVAWLIWCACLVITMYFHLSFFTSVSTDLGEFRAQNSVQVINSSQQIKTVKQALSHISARPVAEVARALSRSTNEKRVAALNEELDEAKRAVKLHDTLITLESNAVTIQSTESNDPVISLLESVTHRNAAVISIAIGTVSALVLELLAAFWWYVLLSIPQYEISVSDVFDSPDGEKLAIVKHAVDTGEIKPTVDAIRILLKCGTGKASFIRDAYLTLQNHSPVASRKAKLDSIRAMQSEKSEIAAQLKKAA